MADSRALRLPGLGRTRKYVVGRLVGGLNIGGTSRTLEGGGIS